MRKRPNFLLKGKAYLEQCAEKLDDISPLGDIFKGCQVSFDSIHIFAIFGIALHLGDGGKDGMQ